MEAEVANIITALGKNPKLLNVFKQLKHPYPSRTSEVADKARMYYYDVSLYLHDLADLKLVSKINADEYTLTDLGRRVRATIEAEERVGELPEVFPSLYESKKVFPSLYKEGRR